MVQSHRRIFNGTAFATICLGVVCLFGAAANLSAQPPQTIPPTPPPTTAMATGVIEHTGPAGLKTYRWDFSRIGDVNFDQWPDDWQRYRGPGYPDYIRMRIIANDLETEQIVQPIDAALAERWPVWRRWVPGAPTMLPSVSDLLVDRCLNVELDGGLVQLQSPRLPTSPLYQYQFGVDVRTEGLKHDLVLAQIVFFGKNGEELTSRSTPSVTKTKGWKRLSIDQVVPPMGARSMLVRLLVQSGPDGIEDIRGTVQFDNISFRQFPQLVITTDRKLGVYRVDEPVLVQANLLGMPEQNVSLRLRVIDHDDRVVSDRTEKVGSTATTDEDLGLNLKWEVGKLPAGFYQVTASMVSDRGASLSAKTSFVTIDSMSMPASGESPDSATSPFEPDPSPFGWTLTPEFIARQRSGELHERDIAVWLRSLGVGWVKLPLWFEPRDTVAAEAAAMLAMRITDQQMRVVGMLDQPPASRVDAYKIRDWKLADGVSPLLRDPLIWRPELEFNMDRMTPRIQTWQLGRSDDFSFTGQFQLSDTIEQIAENLQGFGQPIEIVVPWSWLDAPPVMESQSLFALQRHGTPPMTAAELDSRLDAVATTEPIQRPTWVTIDPITSDEYDRDTRIRDLLLRMATTRGHDVQAAFVSQTFAPERQLLRSDGRPGELLLPFRTTSQLIGDAKNIGSLRMRNKTQNIVFRGAKQSVLMVWSDRPAVEELYLGESVYEVDVWGRRREIVAQPADDPHFSDSRMVHRIEAGSLPRFIVGIDPALAEFRMTVELDRHRIDSVLGQPQSIGVRFSNPISQSLEGNVSIVVPDAWNISQPRQDWQLLPRQSKTIPFTVILGNNATVGDYEIPIDFQFASDPPLRIRLYRPLSVGPEGFELRVETHKVGDLLRVKIELTNRTERAASFDCLLFAGPGRQYERRVLTVPPGETVTRMVDWSDGEALVGTRMLLRAIEQNGNRVINDTFLVRP